MIIHPAHLQIILHVPQCFHFVLSVASFQQTVATHVHSLISTVVAEQLCVRRAPSLGQIAQRIHQKVGAKHRSLKMRPEMFGTQRHFTPQAGLNCQWRLSFLCLGRAAVAQHFAVLLLTLGTGEATFSFTLAAPGLPDTGRTEAVTTGQGLGLAEGVSAHRAGQLFIHGGHRDKDTINTGFIQQDENK